MNLRPGLCSVTLRHLAPETVLEVAVAAGIEGIEWAGDVHVPSGDLDAARAVRRASADAGVAVISYGSYVYAGASSDDLERDGFLPPVRRPSTEFVDAVATADGLGAPTIRVWAGPWWSAEATPDQRARVAADLHEMGERATEAGLRVALEFHQNTLTDSAVSTRSLLDEVDHDAVFVYWQPNGQEDPSHPDPTIGEAVDLLGPDSAHIHVFTWGAYGQRHPLEVGAHWWPSTLATWAAAPTTFGLDRYACLEFVVDDDPDRLRADAATLRRWCRPGEG